MRACRLLGLLLSLLVVGCEADIAPRPTPVPGAAATAARAAATVIPTPLRTPAAEAPPIPVVPSSSPLPSSGSPSPSPAPRDPLAESSVADVRRTLELALGSSRLSGLETLLLDKVSLATPAGGEVLDRQAALRWLRDRAGPGLRLAQFESAQDLALLEAQTEGWPNKDPIERGRVTFSLRPYDAAGQQDDQRGSWKIDVVTVE